MGGCNGRRVGGGEGSDGTIVLGEMDEWVCEARYHAKQHEKTKENKISKIKEIKSLNPQIKARLQPGN